MVIDICFDKTPSRTQYWTMLWLITKRSSTTRHRQVYSKRPHATVHHSNTMWLLSHLIYRIFKIYSSKNSTKGSVCRCNRRICSREMPLFDNCHYQLGRSWLTADNETVKDPDTYNVVELLPDNRLRYTNNHCHEDMPINWAIPMAGSAAHKIY
jgi:hypothetical protein